MNNKLACLIFVFLFLSGCSNTIESELEEEYDINDIVHVEKLNKNLAFALLEEETGWIGINILQRAKFKWKIVSHRGTIGAGETAMNIAGSIGPLDIPGKTLYYTGGIILNDDIAKITVFNEKTNEEIATNIITTDKGTRVFFMVTDGNVNWFTYSPTWNAYSSDGKLLSKY
ncbi:hypothetical protein KHA96_13045 [Bacillus sp. FJAT-49711]|uniref:hypothetical protein n=1 Tax=Bacillus sp. FJAT-49711 TaxID=2833585 RepID=UPI001BC9BECA|nr:hypothetical protein [Bacillus sp. FJAT-49711]MBS4219245.1 hypothetical protein [Bacillus sp. FJAT-49711]